MELHGRAGLSAGFYHLARRPSARLPLISRPRNGISADPLVSTLQALRVKSLSDHDFKRGLAGLGTSSHKERDVSCDYCRDDARGGFCDSKVFRAPRASAGLAA